MTAECINARFVLIGFVKIAAIFSRDGIFVPKAVPTISFSAAATKTKTIEQSL
jgi:hypothetical protein